jgi:hypothetical protein
MITQSSELIDSFWRRGSRLSNYPCVQRSKIFYWGKLVIEGEQGKDRADS